MGALTRYPLDYAKHTRQPQASSFRVSGAALYFSSPQIHIAGKPTSCRSRNHFAWLPN